MTIEIESVDVEAIEGANLVSADIGGVSFPRSLMVSEADWHFLASSVDEPPVGNPVIGRLLSTSSVLER